MLALFSIVIKRIVASPPVREGSGHKNAGSFPIQSRKDGITRAFNSAFKTEFHTGLKNHINIRNQPSDILTQKNLV